MKRNQLPAAESPDNELSYDSESLDKLHFKGGLELSEAEYFLTGKRRCFKDYRQCAQESFQRWRRPHIWKDQDNTGPLTFFLVDIDYTMEIPSSSPKIIKKCAFKNQEVPVIRLFGCTQGGHSVMAHVHGFFPYFYCDSPAWRNCTESLQKKLEASISSASGATKNMEKLILNVEQVERKSLMYYKGEKQAKFFKITTAIPRLVATCRGVLEDGLVLSDDGFVVKNVYEANIPFSLRYMVDTKTTGCSWITASEGTYYARPANQYTSTCQFEFDIHYSDLIPHQPYGIYQAIAPLRIISFDIECIKIDGSGFPDASEDPVIQISSILMLQNEEEPSLRCIFTLGECAPIVNALVFSFLDEKAMLLSWADFIREIDPDILTGYNSINFDIAYLIQRSHALKIQEFRFLGRIKNDESKIKDATFSSKAYGTHENKEINMDGRVQFDILDLIRREYKLKSYTLNYVSSEFLNEQKEDVHYSMIGDLQRGNAETRKRIAVYCLKDAYLPLRLIQKLMLLINSIEMARVTGTPITFLLTRGQQIKVTSQILRKCAEVGFIMPSVKRFSNGETQFEGATVLEPRKGFYPHPIATLDFSSLYPSIMIAHNLCYSTLLSNAMDSKSFNPSYITPSTTDPVHYFVKPSIRKGLLPMIVEDLIAARKVAKAEMNQTTCPFTKMVLNGRQLALKITANSVYGYTGATAGGQLPCLEIASSITCFGRDMIQYCKKRLEELCTVANGYQYNASVIYGDTDSVMIDFGHSEIEEAMRLGLEFSKRLTEEFLSPIKLEFEKVYCPFLLMNKKRYAGLLYTKPEAYDKMDTKGIETVRRDFSPLIQVIVDTVLRRILIEKDVEGAKDFVRQKISDLLQNKVDISLLIVTKSLGKADYGVKLPHVELARKLRKRDAGSAPSVGDRVSYIITKGLKGQAQYERAEDPLYVLDNNLAVDTQHYLESMKSPVSRIFEAVMNNPESLFSGAHTRNVTILTSTDSALSKFIKKTLQCAGCKTVIKAGVLCRHCKENKGISIVLEKAKATAAKEEEYNSLWSECQRCQSSLIQDILCVNRDCPIFYRRAKVKKDLQVLEDAMYRLNSEW